MPGFPRQGGGHGRIKSPARKDDSAVGSSERDHGREPSGDRINRRGWAPWDWTDSAGLSWEGQGGPSRALLLFRFFPEVPLWPDTRRRVLQRARLPNVAH